MRSYNVAVIGAGNMGMHHIMRVSNLENAKLFCVVDKNIEKAEQAANKYNAEHFFDDYKKAIDLKETDIVVIATYSSSHMEILEYAIKRGKHVLCEKPMTPDVKTSKKFVKLAKKSGSKVLIGHILRFHEGFEKMKEMVDADAIGSPLLFRMVHSHNIITAREKFHSLLADTAPIVDCGVHYVDYMRYVTGAEVIDCDGSGMIVDDDCPKGSYNYGVITVKLADGSIGVYEAGWGNTIASEVRNEIIGPKGRINYVYSSDRSDGSDADLIEYFNYETQKFGKLDIACDRRPTHNELSYLIEMIENGAQAKPSLDDVFRAFEICSEVDKKIRKKMKIK